MIKTVSILPYSKRMMRHSKSGTKRLVLHRSVFSVSDVPITSGSMVKVPAVPVRKYIMTVVKSMAAVSLIVRLAVNVTDIWKSGMTYFHSFIMMVREIIPNLKRRILIPVWDLSVLHV